MVEVARWESVIIGSSIGMLQYRDGLVFWYRDAPG